MRAHAPSLSLVFVSLAVSAALIIPASASARTVMACVSSSGAGFSFWSKLDNCTVYVGSLENVEIFGYNLVGAIEMRWSGRG
ncbi:MAG: hypothetical protein ACSLFR_11905, partial [Solirubrobacteraceae bacterium]